MGRSWRPKKTIDERLYYLFGRFTIHYHTVELWPVGRRLYIIFSDVRFHAEFTIESLISHGNYARHQVVFTRVQHRSWA